MVMEQKGLNKKNWSKMNITIQQATADNIHEIAVMVGELLDEIMTSAGIQDFNFNPEETEANLKDFMDQGKYIAFVAKSDTNGQVAFITLYESYALYTKGIFGTIPEFFVRPKFRSQGIGGRRMDQVKAFAGSRGWKRLEVTTPPLPQFEKTLEFYEKKGFSISGGRKLRVIL